MAKQAKPAAPVAATPVAATPVAATPVAATPVAATPVAATPVAATPPVLRNGGILATALPPNLRPCNGQACPPALQSMVLSAAPLAKPARAPHVALWVQAALANLAAAGGRATGAALVAPVALPVPQAQAENWGLVPAAGQPGHYTVACPGHVLVYVLGKQFVKA